MDVVSCDVLGCLDPPLPQLPVLVLSLAVVALLVLVASVDGVTDVLSQALRALAASISAKPIRRRKEDFIKEKSKVKNEKEMMR